jgi:hypothetical protein
MIASSPRPSAEPRSAASGRPFRSSSVPQRSWESLQRTSGTLPLTSFELQPSCESGISLGEPLSRAAEARWRASSEPPRTSDAGSDEVRDAIEGLAGLANFEGRPFHVVRDASCGVGSAIEVRGGPPHALSRTSHDVGASSQSVRGSDAVLSEGWVASDRAFMPGLPLRRDRCLAPVGGSWGRAKPAPDRTAPAPRRSSLPRAHPPAPCRAFLRPTRRRPRPPS